MEEKENAGNFVLDLKRKRLDEPLHVELVLQIIRFFSEVQHLSSRIRPFNVARFYNPAALSALRAFFISAFRFEADIFFRILCLITMAQLDVNLIRRVVSLALGESDYQLGYDIVYSFCF